MRIKHIDANIKAYLDARTGRPVIREVTVLKLDGVDVQLPGLGWFERVTSIVSSAFITAFKGQIKGLIEKGILNAANNAINKTSMRFI